MLPGISSSNVDGVPCSLSNCKTKDGKEPGHFPDVLMGTLGRPQPSEEISAMV